MKNTSWIKFIALFLAILTLLPMALACKDEEVITQEETQETTEAETTPQTITLVDNKKSEYAVVRPSRATDAEIAAASALRDAIKEKCGIKLKILNELDIKNEKAICVGRVERDSVNKLTADIDYPDYVIGVSGTDVVICGGSDEKTTEAVERFITEYLSTETKTITLAGDLKILSIDPNKKTVNVGDFRLIDYSIIVPIVSTGRLTQVVEDLDDHCIEKFGFGFDIKTSATAATGKEIIIGDTNRAKPASVQAELSECGTDYGTIFFEDGNIWITGNVMYAVISALEVFIDDYVKGSSKDGDVFTLSTDNRRIDCSGTEYLAMSYNVLCSGGVGYPKEDVRVQMLINQVASINPDVVGLQECTVAWYDAFNARLVDNGIYGVVGDLNDPSGQKWRNPIYYNKNKFDLLASGTKWLSNTPDVKSRLTDGAQYRIMTYVVLKDKVTGEVFAHTNTHLGFGENDRPAQDEILLKLSADIGEEHNCPVIITGDFNTGDYAKATGRTREEFFDHYNQGGFTDSAQMTSSANRESSVDIVFTSHDSINVVSHNIFSNVQNGYKLSDHKSTIAKFRIKKAN